MPISPTRRGPRRVVVSPFIISLGLFLATPLTASAQGGLAKRAAQVAFCAGAGYAGLKIGEKIAQMEAKRRNLASREAAKLSLGLKIGTAAILCKVGASLAGTVYDGFSKRDMDARQKEIEAAVAEADPVSRDYVLPESGRTGAIVTEPVYQDGNKECKMVVDNLADVKAGEPAMAKYCRKTGGKWELDFI